MDIAIFTLLATFVTSAVTFWTVYEFRKQRKNVYIPDLYLEDQILYVYKARNRFIFSIKEDLEEGSVNFNFISPCPINLFNIGFASAKNIKCKWDCDIRKIIELINTIDSENVGEIKINASGILEFSKSHWRSIDVPQISSLINFILPSKENDKITSVYFPFLILELYALLHQTFFEAFENTTKKENLRFTNLGKFPPVNLEISYKDLTNKLYRKNFLLKLTSSNYTFPNENSKFTQLFPLYIKIEED